MKVEYIRVLDNGIWDTVVVDVPLPSSADREALAYWAEHHLLTQAQHRRVILFAASCWPYPAQDDCEDVDDETPPAPQ